MLRDQKFIVREADYGEELHFCLRDLKGKAYAIPTGATITFECYADGAVTLTVNDSTHTAVVMASDGHVKYTIQSADFGTSAAGIYWCRIKVNGITSFEAALIVKDEYSNGE
jgi:hypothetical protein